MSLQIEPLPDNRIRAEIGKLMAQTMKLSAEQAKFNAESERAWTPIVAVLSAMGVGAAVAVVLPRLCGL